ncbi:MAG: preprotein translocase subunit SecG [Spirochaetes bacterium]|nr:preprotein translocase subunit SecG [Spirochaetota bacterium]
MGAVILNVLIVFLILNCVLMVLSILLQEDKSGGGIGMIGGSSQSFFGASSSTILSKITTIMLTVFLVLSVTIAIVSSSFTRQSVISVEDIEKTELEIADEGIEKKVIAEVPAKVLVEDFDTQFFNLIRNNKDKEFVETIYETEDQYYVLKKKLNKSEEERILGLLRSVGFTLESETTVIKTE